MNNPYDNQIKPYPVQKSYPVQPTLDVSLTCQPGVQQSVAPLQPTSFHDAVGSLKIDVIDNLLRQNPLLVDQRGFNGQLPLHRACLRGDAAIVGLLLRYKADPNAVDDFCETPLHFACKRANLKVIRCLLQSGADLQAEDKAGKGVLHHAAHGGSVMMIHYLLEAHGLNPLVRDRNVSTPMHIVCMHGHVEAFDYLLKKERCALFSKDAQGNTLLHVAASNGNGRMCWQLLQHGGYHLLREVNVEGCTALELAKRGSQKKYAEIVRMLSHYSRRPDRSGPIGGPVLAWYGLLLLPFALFPVSLLLANCFTNRGPVMLVGVILILALRLFHSHRMNHVCRWPSPAHAGMFAAGMFYTTSCYYLEILPYLWSAGFSFLVGLSLVLTFVMAYMYAILMTKDPGVVRLSHHKADMGSLYSIADIASGQLEPDKFCTVCEVIPPPLSSHCRLCEKCCMKVDHHCLYLYRCVAVNNHRLFVFFNAVVLVCMILFEYACTLHVRALFPSLEPGWNLTWEVFSTCPAIWSLCVLNGFSIIWGVWLLRIQLLTISKGRIMAYQPYFAASQLTTKQRTMNVVWFILNREPYASDTVYDDVYA